MIIIVGLVLINVIGIVSAVDNEFQGFLDWFHGEGKLSSFIIPAGMWGIPGAIVGIITLAIILSIVYDIIMLSALVFPFISKRTGYIITAGTMILIVMTRINVSIAGWLFSLGATIFGLASIAAYIAIIVLSLGILLAVFFGGNKVTNWIINIRTTQENKEKITKAREAGGDIAALQALAKEAKT